MLKIDGSYLFNLGKSLRPLAETRSESTYFGVWVKIFQAKPALEGVLKQSVFSPNLRLSAPAGAKLLEHLEKIEKHVFSSPDAGKVEFDDVDKDGLFDAYTEFETVFKAEFSSANIFLTTPKGGYDVGYLVDYGRALFPTSLEKKVNGAIFDIEQATRCLAFELWTAAGFHLHRANESVVIRYMKILGEPKINDKDRNLGKYIGEIERLGGEPRIISCLRDLKDLHRNPLMHPDQSLEGMDDTLALLSAVHNAIATMLKHIPGEEE